MLIQDINFRPKTEEDYNFIFNSWLKSYRESEFAKHMINPVYFENHSKIIENILNRSVVIVACNPEDSNQIYGYIVFEQVEDVTIVHYVYIKFPYRKFGIGNELFRFAQPDSSEFSLATHLPRNHEMLFTKYNCIFNPYKL